MFYSYTSDEVRTLCNANSRVVFGDENQVRDHCALLAMKWFKEIYVRLTCTTTREMLHARRTYPAININADSGDVFITIREHSMIVPGVNYHEQKRSFRIR